MMVYPPYKEVNKNPKGLPNSSQRDTLHPLAILNSLEPLQYTPQPIGEFAHGIPQGYLHDSFFLTYNPKLQLLSSSFCQ